MVYTELYMMGKPVWIERLKPLGKHLFSITYINIIPVNLIDLPNVDVHFF